MFQITIIFFIFDIGLNYRVVKNSQAVNESGMSLQRC